MKAYTDIVQSKKLAEILPIESADMHYAKVIHGFDLSKDWKFEEQLGSPSNKAHIPCWSLAALLSVLPFYLIVNNQSYRFSMIKGFNNKGETYAIKYAVFNTTFYLHLTDFYNNPIDACYEMVLKLKEENLL